MRLAASRMALDEARDLLLGPGMPAVAFNLGPPHQLCRIAGDPAERDAVFEQRMQHLAESVGRGRLHVRDNGGYMRRLEPRHRLVAMSIAEALKNRAPRSPRRFLDGRKYQIVIGHDQRV